MVAIVFWVLIVLLWLLAAGAINLGRFGAFVVPILFTIVGLMLMPLKFFHL